MNEYNQNQGGYFNQAGYSQPMTKQKKKRAGGINLKKLLPILVVLELVVILALSYYTFVYSGDNQYQRIINKIEDKAEVEKDEDPALLRLTDIDSLKQENAIQQEVYKDAENGDYVLLYSDLMLIYSNDEEEIVYNDLPPSQVANRNAETLINDIITKAKESGAISNDSTETPDVSVITDAATFKQNDPEFYSDIEVGDVVAVFDQSKVVVLYRSTTKLIYKTGTVNTEITTR